MRRTISIRSFQKVQIQNLFCKENSRLEVWLPRRSQDLEQWIQYEGLYGGECNEKKVVGFDIEWRPSFQKGRYNKAALVQIAGKSSVVLIQMKAFKVIPPNLIDLISSKKIIKVLLPRNF